MPLLVYGNGNYSNFLDRVSFEKVNNLCNVARMFYYPFVLISIHNIMKLKKINIRIGKNVENLSNQFVVMSMVILTIICTFFDLLKVNFSITTFFRMLLDPRSFTYLREGLGPITYVVNCSKMLLLFISILYFAQNKNLFSIALLFYGCVINILGGSKSSLFVVIIFLILYLQKIKKIQINLFRLILSGCIIFIVAIASFTIMSGSIEIHSITDALNFVIDYAQEAYFSANVLKDFNWNISNLVIEMKSIVFTPIPRAIFSGKELYGFYQECWRNVYQVGTVIYQTSTYGFFSEGHMIFGSLFPIVSAIFINVFLDLLYRKYAKAIYSYDLFIVGYLFTRVYFYTRTGYLDAMNIWALIVFIIFSKLFFKFIGKQKIVYNRLN